MNTSKLIFLKGELKLDIIKLINRFEKGTNIYIKEMNISLSDDYVRLDKYFTARQVRKVIVEITLDI